MKLFLLVLLLSLGQAQSPYYNVPDPIIEALKPKGLRISIPDEPGVELFAIHANINLPMEHLDAGQLSKDIGKATNGRWVYEDKRVRLKPGDTINYWLYVQADGRGYRKDDQTWTVKELVDDTGVPTNPSPEPSKPTVEPPSGCQSTITTVNGQRNCKGQLIFEENFDSLNPSKWQHVVQMARSPDFEFVTYWSDQANSFVKNGNLNVKPTIFPGNDSDISTQKIVLSGCTGTPGSDQCEKKAKNWDLLPPVYSAKLRTKQSFSFCYGRVEIRAKLPIGDWIFPELWLEPKENFYGSSAYSSGLIRLAMARGNRDLTAGGDQIGNRLLEAGCRFGSDEKNLHDELHKKRGNGLWSDEFHTYGVLWTADQITYTVDGQEIGRVTPPSGGFGSSWGSGSQMAPFDKEFYISLGVGVGGYLDFPDNSESGSTPKPWKNWDFKSGLFFWRNRANWHPTWSGDGSSLLVDSVKVWSL